MRKIKTILVAFAVLILGIGQGNVFADTVEPKLDYEITKYDIDVTVGENNVYDITENITADFYVPKHGIFRDIPTSNEVKRQDGTSSNNRAAITDIKVSEKYSTEREDGYLTLKIGDKDKTLTGEQHYTISYKYNIGRDRLEGADEFYFNLIGTRWDTKISGVTFSITMPKEFDTSKIGFSTGTYGSTGSDYVYYKVNGNKISGRVYKTLARGEGLNVRIELPEGYYVNAGITVSPIYYAFYIVPLIGLAVAIYVWSKYGRDRKIFVKPEYFPPEGLNSLEVGFFYKGVAGSKDALSLLIYLANKGYLKVETVEGKKGLFGEKEDVKLIKLKDYNGDKSSERKFLSGLFTDRDEVLVSDLYNKFYKTTSSILSNINSEKNRNKIFEKTGKWSFLVGALAVLSYALITIPPFMLYGDTEYMILALTFPLFGFGAIAAAPRVSEDVPFIKLFLSFWGLGFGGIPYAFVVVPQILLVPELIWPYVVGVIAIIGMVVFFNLIPRRTEYGAQKLAEMKGFKDFLKSVEKDRIEKMVEEYPTYFYDILPYAYVLGVSNKWIKKFEDMNLTAPDWYDSADAFSVGHFMGTMSSTMTAAN
ncbi:DUF2207 domain-containing protein, partial [Candidatus Saccharibacteria bacterium]|nr:DUF2207 domain-containing protein [Candidatus Saccharibacteria bacterium]